VGFGGWGYGAVAPPPNPQSPIPNPQSPIPIFIISLFKQYKKNIKKIKTKIIIK
jgi:hypothetical protein